MAAIEDLVIMRLAKAKHFQNTEALDQAVTLAAGYPGRLDEEYLDEFARRQDVVDILMEVRAKIGPRSST